MIQMVGAGVGSQSWAEMGVKIESRSKAEKACGERRRTSEVERAEVGNRKVVPGDR